MSDWKTCESAPINKVVMTKIDDGRGVRNTQPMKYAGNLWWFPDGLMYAYYAPTHWRPLTTEEREKELAQEIKKIAEQREQLNLRMSKLAEEYGK